MVVINKRLLFWLVKAYIKKWGKVIVLSFVAGVIVFVTLLSTSRLLLRLLPIEKKASVGYVGAYTVDSLPQDIVKKLSRGLTKLENDGTITNDVAKSWEIKNDGKTYVFSLQDNIFFSDGKKLTAQAVPYEFAGVKKEILSNTSLSYTLSDQYSPFLITVSRPIIRQGFVGIGDYTIQNVEVNGNFIKTLTLISRKNRLLSERYSFYPSEEALKIAFVLGEVNKAVGLSNEKFQQSDIASFANTSVQKTRNPAILVTLFFNTKDQVLSDPKVRNGLAYALPESFANGQRTFLPYSPSSKYANRDGLEKHQDFSHANLLLEASLSSATSSAKTTVVIKTLAKYRATAEAIKEAWGKVNIQTTIEEVENIPASFQVYLGDFVLPRDPDQYTLWHSTSPNNITKLKNLRIDKLLEDGRKTTDEKERIKIYSDFQKYLLDDSPAAFLYFPYEYTVERK